MSSTRTSRDAGLEKVSRVTKWLAVGAIAVAGVLSAVTAKALPGKSKTTVQSGASGSQSPSQSQDSPAATDNGAQSNAQDNSGLLPPNQPPVAGNGGSGAVSSGAS